MQKSLCVYLDYMQEYFAKDSVNFLHKQGIFTGREQIGSPTAQWSSLLCCSIRCSC